MHWRGASPTLNIWQHETGDTLLPSKSQCEPKGPRRSCACTHRAFQRSRTASHEKRNQVQPRAQVQSFTPRKNNTEAEVLKGRKGLPGGSSALPARGRSGPGAADAFPAPGERWPQQSAAWPSHKKPTSRRSNSTPGTCLICRPSLHKILQLGDPPCKSGEWLYSLQTCWTEPSPLEPAGAPLVRDPRSPAQEGTEGKHTCEQASRCNLHVQSFSMQLASADLLSLEAAASHWAVPQKTHLCRFAPALRSPRGTGTPSADLTPCEEGASGLRYTSP